MLSTDTKLDMFWTMLLSRRLDERSWVLHRQGRIAFHISGIGQEAAQVGAAFALRRGYDWFLPYYRDIALMIALGYTPRDFALSMMGKAEDITSAGRQMPSHWSLRSANVPSQSATVATQTSHAAGIGLAMKLRGEDKVVLTCIGEGSTSQGEWYEGVNWAAIHRLPVIFLVQNNQYAISERVERQMAVPGPAAKACGLGLDGRVVDGTDVFQVYQVILEVAEKARRGEGPGLVEAKLYRITPHSSDDDDRTYRSREEVEAYKKRDPLLIAQTILQKEGILTPEKLNEMEAKAKQIVDEAVVYAERAPYPEVDETAIRVFAGEVTHA